MKIQEQKDILVPPDSPKRLLYEWRVALDALIDCGKIKVDVLGIPRWVHNGEYIGK